MSKHDDKRRARFKEAGLTGDDLRYAHTAYLGRSEDSCCLCDTGIVHNFRLTFDLPTGDPRGTVVMDPVGSQCITDWMRAFPASPERDAALARVKDAEKEKNRQMAAHKRRATLLSSLDKPQARQLQRYWDAPPAVQDDPTLADIAGKVERRGAFASDRQFRFFAAKLREAILAQPVQTPARPSAPVAVDDPIPVPTRMAQAQVAEVPPMPAALTQHAPAQGGLFREQFNEPVRDLPGFHHDATPAEVAEGERIAAGNRAAYARMDIEDKVASLHLDDDGAGLMRRYYSLAEQDRTEVLVDIADRVERRGFASDPQRRFFAVKLKQAESASRGAPVVQGRRRERPVDMASADDFPW